MKNNKNNSLKNLINEVMSQKNTIQRMNDVRNSAITLNETTINSLIRSRVFTINEQKAMRILFTKTKTTSLTEGTIKELDNDVRFISKSNGEESPDAKPMKNALRDAAIVFISYILGHFIVTQFNESPVVLGSKPDVFTGSPGF